jgi:hypothetical protein
MATDNTTPERPRVEPEIIPPDRGRRSGWSGETGRIYVRRIGPFGIVMITVALAVITALVVVLLLGAFLLWIPFLVALLVVAAISRWLRS